MSIGAGVSPFLRGGKESKEKSRNERLFLYPLQRRKTFATAFFISRTRSPFAIYFHVSRFFHLWFRDTKGRKEGRRERKRKDRSKGLNR